MTPFDVLVAIAEAKEFLRTLPHIVDAAPIGSATYLPNPADVDVAVLVSCNAITFVASLVDEGWRPCSNYDTQTGQWAAIRHGSVNLMVTHDQAFFDGYKRATEVCKALHLTHKSDRIAVCRIVRDGMTAEESRQPLKPPMDPSLLQKQPPPPPEVFA